METVKAGYDSGHGFLSRNALKYFAVACMVCDHIAVAFVDGEPLKTALTFFGGFTMPIMAFFLAEGYVHTRNAKKYAARIFIFAVLSILPFCRLQTGGWLPVENEDKKSPSYGCWYCIACNFNGNIYILL